MPGSTAKPGKLTPRQRAGHIAGKALLAQRGREYFAAMGRRAWARHHNAPPRRKPGPAPSTVKVSVQLRPDQEAALTRLCASQGTSRSALVREAVDHWLQLWEEACAASRGKVRVRDLGKGKR